MNDDGNGSEKLERFRYDAALSECAEVFRNSTTLTHAIPDAGQCYDSDGVLCGGKVRVEAKRRDEEVQEFRMHWFCARSDQHDGEARGSLRPSANAPQPKSDAS